MCTWWKVSVAVRRWGRWKKSGGESELDIHFPRPVKGSAAAPDSRPAESDLLALEIAE